VTGTRCLEEHELDAVIGLPEGHPALAHVAACPRCRALVDAYRRFLAPGEAPREARAEEADAALDAFRERLLGTASAGAPAGSAAADPLASAARPGVAYGAPDLAAPGAARSADARGPFAAPRRAWRGGLWRVPAPVWAAAAVVVVAGGALLWTSRDGGDRRPTLRGARAGALRLAPPAVEASGAVRIAWSGHPDAESYAVVLFGPDLEEVARFPVLSDSALTLAPDQLPAALPAGSAVLYRVEARRGGDAVAISATGSFTRR